MGSDLPELESALRNDVWMVRHYGPARTETMRLQRIQAIQKLGLTVRHAFNSTDNFEPLLVALAEGFNPHDHKPPF